MAEVDKSEKITINVGLVDLGQIDLLVTEGFYANRTDFIRTAIRRQLEARSGAVDATVARRTLTLGTQHYSRGDLEELRNAGRMAELRVTRPGLDRGRRHPGARPGHHCRGGGPRGVPRISPGEEGPGPANGLIENGLIENGTDRATGSTRASPTGRPDSRQRGTIQHHHGTTTTGEQSWLTTEWPGWPRRFA
jgi:Arc/MetJ-type ribon-helix-helix transcriptional regulator